MNEKQTQTPKSPYGLASLWLLHAAGMKIKHLYCEHCKQETIHGKTPADRDFICTVCLNTPTTTG